MFATLKQQLPRAALIAGLAFAAAPFAHAVVIYTNLSASPLKIPNNFDGIFVNVANGDAGKNFANVPGWDLNFYNKGNGLAFYTNTGASIVRNAGSHQAAVLKAGQLISGVSNLVTGSSGGDAFQIDGQEYLGFSFLNELSGKTNYGWVLLDTTFKNNNNAGFPASIVSFAFENSGAGILAGATVPEPGSMALFGLGALAMGAIARRRRQL